jgi:hypothetical protein
MLRTIAIGISLLVAGSSRSFLCTLAVRTIKSHHHPRGESSPQVWWMPDRHSLIIVIESLIVLHPDSRILTTTG